MQPRRDERSLGELFAELSRESTTLVRQEIALAKAEMTQKATRVGKDVGFLLAGAAVLYAGFLGLLAALILVLNVWLPSWLAAFVVGLVVAGVGGFLVQKGRSALTQEDLAPRQTMETLKEDVEWAKAQTK